MRNPALEALDVLVGSWEITLTNAWFLESLDVEQHGRAEVRWLGDAFIELVAEMEAGGPHGGAGATGERAYEPTWHFVFGRGDVNDRTVALYSDPRPASRIFDVEVEDGAWVLHREDADMHQRFVLRVDGDRIDGRTDASDDGGKTWRKDFDLIFTRDER